MTFYEFINDQAGNVQKMEFQQVLSWLPDFNANDSAEVMAEKAASYVMDLAADLEKQYKAA